MSPRVIFRKSSGIPSTNESIPEEAVTVMEMPIGKAHTRTFWESLVIKTSKFGEKYRSPIVETLSVISDPLKRTINLFVAVSSRICTIIYVERI